MKVFERSLGAEYVTVEKLRDTIRNPQKRLDVFSDQNNNLHAASLYEYLTEADQSNSYVQAFQKNGYLPTEKPFRVGLFGTTAVDKEWRRKGIASAFYKRRFDFFREQECTACISLVWESGKEDSSKPLLSKLGFEELKSVKDYWKQDSIEKNYQCPNCGDPPCRCTATLMALAL